MVILAKIGPAKDRISLTGPRVCPREGDNRPELRLAAATKIGFDAKNLVLDVVATPWTRQHQTRH